MPTSATFSSSATCPSMSRVTPSRCGPRPSSLKSTPPAILSASRERRPISSRPPASTGATPSTTGTPWSPTASPGGRAAFAPPSTCTTSSAWITSAASRPIGRCRSPLPIRHMVHGRRDPASSSSRRSRKSSARFPSLPKTWAFLPPASSTCATPRASLA